jgi:riboflavin kinase/FMN adenylyltransferase
VVRGDQLGRKLGFPTANVQMKHNRPPLQGIFAVEVHGAAMLEVYLLDFDTDIYGCHVQVDFLHKLRDEEKYTDLDTLKRHIARDVGHIRDYFYRGHIGTPDASRKTGGV